MSIFGAIMSKIFHAGGAAMATAAGQTAPAAVAPDASSTAAVTPATPQAAPSATPPPPTPAVDVGAVLTGMAAQKGGGGNWQSSIVDLLKLLDLDSSLDARKQLANELNMHAGAEGSAEENIALHKAVMQKLAENVGNVPADLKG